jgi:xylulokinase
MDYLMGIDLGSTSLKAVVYDLDGNLVASGSRPTEKVHPNARRPEWTVWEPEQIWCGAAAAIRDAVSQLGDPRQVRAVAVTGMGMDGLPVDGNGRWLYPFISWHDPRTGPQLAWWQEHVGVEKTFSIGGNPVWPINSALRIRWMMEHEPEILDRAEKWLLIEDFLNFLLTGRRVTDYSMASCTMLFDQRTLSWSNEMLRLSGIDRRLLCEALPSGTLIGEVTAKAAAQTGLAEGTPVVLGGHDHLCGALPAGVFEPGRVLDVTGTWEIVTVVTEEPVLAPELGRSGMTVQAHVAPGRHAIWGANVAAEMLEWYRRQYGFEAAEKAKREGGSDWEHLIAAAAAAPPGAHGVMFLPHMSGAGCPMVDPKSLGAFVGLSNFATSGDMLRAIVEGLCYQLLDIVRAVESCLDQRLEKFIVVGGATRNAFWMQTKADVLGRPLELPEIEEATPLGAAILAGVGVGLYRDVQDAYRRVNRPGTIYHPDPAAAARYEEGFRIYQQLYPALSPVSRPIFEQFVSK